MAPISSQSYLFRSHSEIKHQTPVGLVPETGHAGSQSSGHCRQGHFGHNALPTAIHAVPFEIIPWNRKVPLRRWIRTKPIDTIPAYSPFHYRQISPSYSRHPSPPGSITTEARVKPEWVLEAPSIFPHDGQYNSFTWSCENVVALAVEAEVFLWSPDMNEATKLQLPPSSYAAASLQFSNDGRVLGVGRPFRGVELWDLESRSQLRTLPPDTLSHYWQCDTSTGLSWNRHILTTGLSDGRICHYDVRLARPLVMKIESHRSDIRSLEWRGDGGLLASSCKRGAMNIWDIRAGDVKSGARGVALWNKPEDACKTIKKVSWCPWKLTLLAATNGGGDGTLMFWDANTTERFVRLELDSEFKYPTINSIQWAPRQEEFLITWGHKRIGGNIMVYDYPHMNRLLDVRYAHKDAIPSSVLGPDGDIVCTGSRGDGLRFWRMWETSK